jgi:hypothetical protein
VNVTVPPSSVTVQPASPSVIVDAPAVHNHITTPAVKKTVKFKRSPVTGAITEATTEEQPNG